MSKTILSSTLIAVAAFAGGLLGAWLLGRHIIDRSLDIGMGSVAYGSEAQAMFATRTLGLLDSGDVAGAIELNCDMVRASLPSLRHVAEASKGNSDAVRTLAYAEASLQRQVDLGRCVQR